MATTRQRKTPRTASFQKLSFELVAQMLFDLEGGESVSSVARRYGVSNPTTRKAGLSPPYEAPSVFLLTLVVFLLSLRSNVRSKRVFLLSLRSNVPLKRVSLLTLRSNVPPKTVFPLSLTVSRHRKTSNVSPNRCMRP